MTHLENGQQWRQPYFPHHAGTVQYIDNDLWVLTTLPYLSARGHRAVATISDPDGGGQVFYTEEEMLTRLARHGWKPVPIEAGFSTYWRGVNRPPSRHVAAWWTVWVGGMLVLALAVTAAGVVLRWWEGTS